MMARWNCGQKGPRVVANAETAAKGGKAATKNGTGQQWQTSL